MDYYGLSEPIKINTKENTIEEEINNIYNKVSNFFINKDCRPKLNGNFIYINNNFIERYNERYLHSTSLRDKEYYTMFPCNNDVSYATCKTNCKIKRSPSVYIRISRALCIYRLSRVHWISEIIDLANKKDDNIKIWRKREQDLTNKAWVWKRYVRYQNGIIDYVIIFKEVYKNGRLNVLNLITGFPVFMKRDKERFDKAYCKKPIQ